MRNKYSILIILGLLSNSVFSQDSLSFPPLTTFKIFESDLTYFAPNYFQGENYQGHIQTSLFDSKLQLPVKLKDEKTILNNAIEFASLNPNLANTNLDTGSKLDFYSIAYEFSYIRKLGTKQWTLITSIKPTLASDFNNSVVSEDFLLQGFALITKRWNRFSKFGFGAVHSNKFGRKTTLPLLQFIRKKGGHETDVLLPAYLKQSYHFGQNRIGASLFVRGGSYNFDTPPIFVRDLDKLIFTKLDGALEYEAQVEKGLALSFKIGYTLLNKIEFLNQNAETVLEIKPENDFFVGVGLIWQK